MNKNIYIIPTDKPSKLVKRNLGLIRVADNFTKSDLDFILAEFVNINITSDEEITGFENNIWVIKGDRVFLWQNTMALVSNNKPRKIILTTDQDLIQDGIQKIDDEFLEWFVKNPSCEEVEVRKGYKNAHSSNTVSEFYKIFIPKDEDKRTIKKEYVDDQDAYGYDVLVKVSGKKETFEEAVRPLMEYLGNNHHPHTSVYVRADLAEISEGLVAFKTKEYKRLIKKQIKI